MLVSPLSLRRPLYRLPSMRRTVQGGGGFLRFKSSSTPPRRRDLLCPPESVFPYCIASMKTSVRHLSSFESGQTPEKADFGLFFPFVQPIPPSLPSTTPPRSSSSVPPLKKTLRSGSNPNDILNHPNSPPLRKQTSGARVTTSSLLRFEMGLGATSSEAERLEVKVVVIRELLPSYLAYIL